MRDVRLLSIDIDALQKEGQVIRQFHIGVSLLDTCRVEASILGSRHAALDSQMIESHHFVVGSPKYSRRKSNKFLFGQFEVLSLADLPARIGGMASGRDIILVCHGGAQDLAVLDQINLDL
jgi:hypothetical protein